VQFRCKYTERIGYAGHKRLLGPHIQGIVDLLPPSVLPWTHWTFSETSLNQQVQGSNPWWITICGGETRWYPQMCQEKEPETIGLFVLTD
jgi:hypothetical protein